TRGRTRTAKPSWEMNPDNETSKGSRCLKEIPVDSRKSRTGWLGTLAEPIKALAFNTLLSSQETDTHRARSACASLAPGRLALRYQFRPVCQFHRSSPISPFPVSRSGDVSISPEPSDFAKSGGSEEIEIHLRARGRDETALSA
ncbi:hypothetical protein, partial [Actinomadura kijaniata]|uniref:hypothetical protein n=1 Tax=Actinomadura kijaniata TaxID=46161 RepID=UPI001C3F3F5D